MRSKLHSMVCILICLFFSSGVGAEDSKPLSETSIEELLLIKHRKDVQEELRDRIHSASKEDRRRIHNTLGSHRPSKYFPDDFSDYELAEHIALLHIDDESFQSALYTLINRSESIPPTELVEINKLLVKKTMSIPFPLSFQNEQEQKQYLERVYLKINYLTSFLSEEKTIKLIKKYHKEKAKNVDLLRMLYFFRFQEAGNRLHPLTGESSAQVLHELYIEMEKHYGEVKTDIYGDTYIELSHLGHSIAKNILWYLSNTGEAGFRVLSQLEWEYAYIEAMGRLSVDASRDLLIETYEKIPLKKSNSRKGLMLCALATGLNSKEDKLTRDYLRHEIEPYLTSNPMNNQMDLVRDAVKVATIAPDTYWIDRLIKLNEQLKAIPADYTFNETEEKKIKINRNYVSQSIDNISIIMPLYEHPERLELLARPLTELSDEELLVVSPWRRIYIEQDRRKHEVRMAKNKKVVLAKQNYYFNRKYPEDYSTQELLYRLDTEEHDGRKSMAIQELKQRMAVAAESELDEYIFRAQEKIVQMEYPIERFDLELDQRRKINTKQYAYTNSVNTFTKTLSQHKAIEFLAFAYLEQDIPNGRSTFLHQIELQKLNGPHLTPLLLTLYEQEVEEHLINNTLRVFADFHETMLNKIAKFIAASAENGTQQLEATLSYQRWEMTEYGRLFPSQKTSDTYYEILFDRYRDCAPDDVAMRFWILAQLNNIQRYHTNPKIKGSLQPAEKDRIQKFLQHEISPYLKAPLNGKFEYDPFVITAAVRLVAHSIDPYYLEDTLALKRYIDSGAMDINRIPKSVTNTHLWEYNLMRLKYELDSNAIPELKHIQAKK